MDLAFNTGGVCNGGGLPLTFNSTTTIYCDCFPDYSGSADFFDAGKVLAPDGRILALGCSNFRPAEIALWAVVLCFALLRMFYVSKLFYEKYSKLKAKHAAQQLPFLLNSFALKVLFFDMCTVFPLLTTVCALKISGKTIGTDIGTTLLFIFSVVTFQVGNEILAGEEFRVVTEYLPAEKKQQLRKLRFLLQLTCWTAYAVGIICPYFISLAMDKSLGPIDNGQYITLLVRNLASYPWCMSGSVANLMVFKRLEHLMSSLADSKSRGALQQMRQANMAFTRLYASVCLVFTVFSLPWLWGFQTYSYVVVVGAGALRHPAKAFQSNNDLLHEATNSSNNNTPSPLRTIGGNDNNSSKQAVTSDNGSKTPGSLVAFPSNAA